MSKKNFLILFFVAVSMIAFLSCGEAESKKKVREYNVMVMQPTSRQLSSIYSATIRGKQDIDIRPKVSGYITDIFVKEGSVVKKGQTLFVIDQVPYQAALQTAIANVDVAQAAVDAAELTANSKEELFKQNIISEFDLNLSKTTLASQRAQLAQAKANEINARNNLSYTEVKSPADGVVGTLPFRVGTLVSPSDKTPLTSVSDNSEMYVYFSMTESQVLSLTRIHGSLENALKAMPSIDLQLSDGTIYQEKGRIEAISGIIDQTTGSVTVRAKYPNSKRLLLSGGSGNVILPHNQEGCIVIPQSATYEIQDKVFVYRVNGGVAKAQMVSVFNISNGKEYVIQNGISAGDTIVIEGVGLLRDNTKIKIKDIKMGE
ncbi:MAG: efflux RND transporter periplasmic adaptor subunit [Alistipes sp.]|nr:efflux RND transporter periplasmic adaptor subunit [Candidatus Alistipes equi]